MVLLYIFGAGLETSLFPDLLKNAHEIFAENFTDGCIAVALGLQALGELGINSRIVTAQPTSESNH